MLGILLAFAQAAPLYIPFDLKAVPVDPGEIIVTGRADGERFLLRDTVVAAPKSPRLGVDLGKGAKAQFEPRQGRLGDAQIGVTATIPF